MIFNLLIFIMYGVTGGSFGFFLIFVVAYVGNLDIKWLFLILQKG
jgi:hypothetical protein